MANVDDPDEHYPLEPGAYRLSRVYQHKAVRMMETKRAEQIVDPRALTLPQDSALWFILLAWALGDEVLTSEVERPSSLYGSLHGCRCGGSRLVQDGTTVRLSRGDWPVEEWSKVRERWLLPHTPRLRALLVALGEWARKETGT
jgi:hypothetical protein